MVHPQYNGSHYRYGQVVVGPCGSGKTTYCDGMQQYLQLLGRNAVIVNLDPANNHIDVDASTDTDKNMITSDDHINTALPYTAIYDICTEAVNLKSVMKQMQLGPNGALIYCMEYIELHSDEIIESILSRSTDIMNAYYIFDFPGQIELYTHSTCVQSLLQKLTTKFQMKLTAVQLIDALYCTDVTKFISAALLGTTAMIRLELPTVNVLSKVDLLSSYGTLPLQLDYYTECYDLERLIPFLYQTNIPNDESIDPTTEEDEYDISDDPDYRRVLQKRQTSKFAIQYEKLHRALAEVVEDYSLLSFIPLDITNVESVGRVLAKVDKCNGYIFSTTTTGRTTTTVHQDLFQCAVQQDGSIYNNMYESLADVRERIASPESIRELRRKK
jgi:GPN-loop GTPase